ncbi:MAG: type VI secretion system tube protein Hcp [Gammaproteobacteria bacterium]|nr:type VI secretion system tube protein Hcp [Gammaproteobacteria bacterium]
MNRLTIALLLAVAIGAPVHAGVYLDIPTIPGEATDSAHEDWIDVESWGQSVANVNNMPVVLPLVFTHAVDKATPKLIEATIMGTNLGTVALEVTRSAPEVEVKFFVLELHNAKVVSIQSSGHVSQVPIFESVTLTCEAFDLTYTEFDASGNSVGEVVATGNCN